MASEYGFSSADISSISNAREGLTAGFMQLGKQIEQDITRIAVTRQLKSFSQELSTLNPDDESFPQRLIQTMSKYPLAANTPMARNGIELLGSRYRANQQAKQQVFGRPFVFSTETGQEMVSPSGETIRTFGPKPERELRGIPFTNEEGITELRDPVSGDVRSEMGRKFSDKIPESLKIEIENQRSDRDALEDRWKSLKNEWDDAKTTKKRAELQVEIDKAEKDLNSSRDTIRKLIKEAEQFSPKLRSPPPLSGGGGVTSDNLALMPEPQNNSPFVPIGIPTNINAPQMTLRREDVVMPDQMPTLPGTVPAPKVAGAPRLYKKVGKDFQVLKGADPQAALKQAYEVQDIGDQEFNFFMSKLKPAMP